jgi:putative protein-disulfide isomerase
MRLLYFADPMCSWCYGFGPQLRKLLAARPDLELQLVMGGLRPFNRDPMSDAFREMLAGHWQQVAQASGLALNPRALVIEGFVYDTEPACRAVVTARSIDASKAFAYYGIVQSAFYRDALDVSREDTLAALSREAGYDESLFGATLRSEPARRVTQHDFETSQRLGVSGFPTLAVAYDADLFLVTSGYVTAEVLGERLAEIDRRVKQAPGGATPG